ncbi:hypothetical protein P692DRAFT_20883798 [Suillus brevipes Sb2]|nr:hypothetical protein P692DRAFT_20883798 [Suillus brevipes Sb2]
MSPPFRFSMPIVLSPDAAGHLLQILADSGHLPPALNDLYQYLTDQAHIQCLHSQSLSDTHSPSCTPIDHCDSIPIPPVSHLPLDSSTSTTAGDVLSKLPTVRHRAQSHTEDTGYSDSSRPTKRPRRSTIHTRSGPPGEPPDPGFDRDRPRFANDDCNRGARRLRLLAQRAAARAAVCGDDLLRIDGGEEEEEEEEEEEAEMEEGGNLHPLTATQPSTVH